MTRYYMAVAGLLAALTPAAFGEARCGTYRFDPAHAIEFENAKMALVKDQDAAQALSIADRLDKESLNCFEEIELRKLRIAALVDELRFDEAANLLSLRLTSETLDESERQQIQGNIETLTSLRK